MDLPDDASGVRAILKKKGEPDIRLELSRTSPVDFAIVEDGKPVGIYYRTLSPPKPGTPGLVHNDTRFSISEAFAGCLSERYPGYVATDIEVARKSEEIRLGVKFTAVIKKESRLNPSTGNKEYYASLMLLDEAGKEYGLPRYLPSFEAVAALLIREAGATHEQLQDRYARYERGEDIRISLTLEDDAVIGRLGFNPNDAGDPK